ncbi:hypothetical protein LO762_15265 [Actinocorallia sp. API 0066]|uniref:hypothetical protein n=1 Tax=Actinocorallia sp. API 0066 TaxID=2896846 RepID=UPI001E41F9BA|nr:hypothetical protein [Actinocorallia sp. API 0066]MCD0450539.1 hypothetical protein [Actinocorallia sp. API 0066]
MAKHSWIVAVPLAVGGALVVAPAAWANTNFNGACQTKEFCGYKEWNWQASQGIYDYEGRDNYFTDNHFKPSSVGGVVDKAISSGKNLGTSCAARLHFGQNGSGGIIATFQPNGDYWNITGSWNNAARSLTWAC